MQTTINGSTHNKDNIPAKGGTRKRGHTRYPRYNTTNIVKATKETSCTDRWATQEDEITQGSPRIHDNRR
jgi:hypothetical protein